MKLKLAPVKYGFSSDEDVGFLVLHEEEFLEDLEGFEKVEVIKPKDLKERFPFTYSELEQETGIPTSKLKYAIIMKNEDEQGFYGVIYFVYSA